MCKPGKQKQSPRLPLLLLLLLLPVGSRAQTATPPSPSRSNDVVLLSLQALDARAAHTQRVSGGLLGNAAAEIEKEKHLLEIQMSIVRATAIFGPVLLLAPDDTTQSAIEQRCKEFQICDLLRTDRVRLKIAPHDGLWIRDFGPTRHRSTWNLRSLVRWRGPPL